MLARLPEGKGLGLLADNAAHEASDGRLLGPIGCEGETSDDTVG
jgi:hypothetical protein